ncbi:uncharacterized protein AKAW2_21282A [Aspergillus luchuensis]|uniref:Uncharacterized protein n=1 Tax=Aspergillus kawachii TaxID=1069201 RepID=A0A7R7W4P6_ASPKA|nr:uncharacterized protein AKAW2_21282A [Aspergillus luchuensis]BCR96342.1 hypothetical protein AKAW2_21282A [Aspergillus luchuensis]
MLKIVLFWTYARGSIPYCPCIRKMKKVLGNHLLDRHIVALYLGSLPLELSHWTDTTAGKSKETQVEYLNDGRSSEDPRGASPMVSPLTGRANQARPRPDKDERG